MRRISTLQPRVTNATATRIKQGDDWRDDKRGANQRGYTYRWQTERKRFLEQHPLCQCPDCDDGRLRVTLATVVDHATPHRGNAELFWDRSNWRAMAKRCHDKKTAGGE